MSAYFSEHYGQLSIELIALHFDMMWSSFIHSYKLLVFQDYPIYLVVNFMNNNLLHVLHKTLSPNL